MSGMRWTEYRGRGFFCRDGLLEVWLAVIVDELDRQHLAGATAPALAAIRDDFRAQATVGFDGLMETRLDPHLDDEESRRGMIALCRNLDARLRRGERPDGPLAARVGAARWARRDTLAGLARIAASFLWLLEEEPSDSVVPAP